MLNPLNRKYDFFGRPIRDEWSWWEGDEDRLCWGRAKSSWNTAPTGHDQRKDRNDHRRDGARLMDEQDTTPLAFLEDVMNGRRQPTLNEMEAAKAILPYRHRKQPVAVEQSGPGGAPIPTNLTVRFVKPDAAGQS